MMKSGPAWRIAPMGTTEVYLVRIEGSVAKVCSRVGTHGWAKRPMLIAAADVFPDRAAARAEYRRRYQAALAADPAASRDVSIAVTQP